MALTNFTYNINGLNYEIITLRMTLSNYDSRLEIMWVTFKTKNLRYNE